MNVIEQPTCERCGVEYVAPYEGPCQEPRCGGHVSYEATMYLLAEQVQGAVEALRVIAEGRVPIPDGQSVSVDTVEAYAATALDHLGGQ